MKKLLILNIGLALFAVSAIAGDKFVRSPSTNPNNIPNVLRPALDGTVPDTIKSYNVSQITRLFERHQQDLDAGYYRYLKNKQAYLDRLVELEGLLKGTRTRGRKSFTEFATALRSQGIAAEYARQLGIYRENLVHPDDF